MRSSSQPWDALVGGSIGVMLAGPDVKAWRPAVPGVVEVFHAHFIDHAYPMHTHDSWALLIVDSGAVRYDLDRHERGALTDLVTLLPPHVPHNGRAATSVGFRKRVLYLGADALDEHMIGRTVDMPGFADPGLRQRIHRLHQAISVPGEEFEAESRLAFVLDRLRERFGCMDVTRTDPSLADRLRDLLDDHVIDGIALADAAAVLHAHPTHLIRAFRNRFGMAPHRYLTSRRVDLARRLLLAGQPASEVALDAGFYDQPHLNRHFRRIVGTSPARFAGRSVRRSEDLRGRG